MRAIIALKVLRDKLSEYVRLVAAGETVLVTDRDLVVAELRRPTGSSPWVVDAVLAESVRFGLLTPPLVVRKAPPDRLAVAPLGELLRDLDADRQDW